jgi:hypothetical protein
MKGKNGNRRAGDAAGNSVGSDKPAEFTPTPRLTQVIVKPVWQKGRLTAFVPHHEPDPLLRDVQSIQLQLELQLEDMRFLHQRVFELINDAKSTRTELANLVGDYLDRTKMK